MATVAKGSIEQSKAKQNKTNVAIIVIIVVIIAAAAAAVVVTIERRTHRQTDKPSKQGKKETRTYCRRKPLDTV